MTTPTIEPSPQDSKAEWQPIDTAPKDRCILGANTNLVSEMIWNDTPDDDGYAGWCSSGFTYGGTLYYLYYEFEPQPTHWMPLPKGPNQ